MPVSIWPQSEPGPAGVPAARTQLARSSLSALLWVTSATPPPFTVRGGEDPPPAPGATGTGASESSVDSSLRLARRPQSESEGRGLAASCQRHPQRCLAPIWHNPILPYWYHPDFVFRSSVVSFRIRLKLEIRIVLHGRRCPRADGAGGYVGPSHTCAGVNSSVAAAVPAVV